MVESHDAIVLGSCGVLRIRPWLGLERSGVKELERPRSGRLVSVPVPPTLHRQDV